MQNDNFEETLPNGYKQVFHINATNKKTGLIFTLLSFIPIIIVMVIAVFALFLKENVAEEFDLILIEISTLVFIICLVAYVILHELIHGIAYKTLTGRKLTFGLSWSCAFCGVPDIFVYRKTAIIALVMPFAVFTVILLPLTIIFYFINCIVFLLFALLLSLHWGGCVGDLFLLWLLLFKYKDRTLLMKDTGPEQFLYLQSEN